MAPYKKPLTLQKLSLKAIAAFINIVCDILHKVHGKYDPSLCKGDITRIQNHILSYIPGDLMDQVCNEWINTEINYDPRFFIAVYMHRHMKQFNFGQIHAALSPFCNSSFWRSLLCQTSSIVSINLSYICTDEILKVVGKNCCNLEYINISSPTLDSQGRFFPVYFTDIGLGHLERCKALKTVEMDRDIVSKSKLKVSREGIRHLLKNLPVVENISFGQMGSIIAFDMQDVNSLPLTHIIETDAEVKHILAILRLCPNLKDLTFSSSFDETYFFSAIKDSTLELSAFHVDSFDYDRTMYDFLIVKGMHLTCLDLNGTTIMESLVEAIGRYCPNLISLTLNQYVDWADNPDLLQGSNETMFSKLESLKIHRGVRSLRRNRGESVIIQVRRILQMILVHAKKIQVLKLHVACNNSFDDVFNEILQSNPLTELTELHASCNLSMKTILYFLRRPNMRKLSLRESRSVTDKDISMLMNEISENNLDIVLHTFHCTAGYWTRECV